MGNDLGPCNINAMKRDIAGIWASSYPLGYDWAYNESRKVSRNIFLWHSLHYLPIGIRYWYWWSALAHFPPKIQWCVDYECIPTYRLYVGYSLSYYLCCCITMILSIHLRIWQWKQIRHESVSQLEQCVSKIGACGNAPFWSITVQCFPKHFICPSRVLN